MEPKKFEILMMDYLSDTLEADDRKKFEAFLQDNPDHQKKFAALNQTWDQMNDLNSPEPSTEMDDRFFDMLHTEIEKSKKQKSNSTTWLTSLAELLWKPQMAYGLLLLGMGLMGGYLFNESGNAGTNQTTVVASTDETEEVRGQLVLTLLDQPSANQRLQGINEVKKIGKIDQSVIKALLQTLNNDANVNVRLAAIESLTNYLDDPMVREGLVQSIVKQESPIIQVTLANLMVALQEKKSIEPFKTLMRTKELDKSVKQKLESSINSII